METNINKNIKIRKFNLYRCYLYARCSELFYLRYINGKKLIDDVEKPTNSRSNYKKTNLTFRKVSLFTP